MKVVFNDGAKTLPATFVREQYTLDNPQQILVIFVDYQEDIINYLTILIPDEIGK